MGRNQHPRRTENPLIIYILTNMDKYATLNALTCFYNFKRARRFHLLLSTSNVLMQWIVPLKERLGIELRKLAIWGIIFFLVSASLIHELDWLWGSVASFGFLVCCGLLYLFWLALRMVWRTCESVAVFGFLKGADGYYIGTALAMFFLHVPIYVGLFAFIYARIRRNNRAWVERTQKKLAPALCPPQ